ncbi:hypothetical protein [Clostridium amazonitimonense]|nr:hypothetical protein [Clostridium amazonitimonense]
MKKSFLRKENGAKIDLKDIIEKTVDKLLVFHMVKIGEKIC